MKRGPKPRAPRHDLKVFRDRLNVAPAYVIIINALHQRGALQKVALEVLKERGLWLTEEQKGQAGLTT